MNEKEQEYIGLVVDIDPSVHAVNETFTKAIEKAHSANPEATTMSYPC